ncbi:hypothetical protein OO007_05675 [Cocleimonas sp. KMM 6892]|uniref:hypothetical protein n=1 Tax=unclassified Cocleimonas TaxID=2639732 RepID=UPI002DB87806|nr:MULTISPECIES: hypothetical protein [unclassified Cocleimonas]MEB8431709.1 hypothetical protein [Cocleimonas sp. KMM 6892]MEC4715205.1 hypothetical protein [Cocleimonas sp. KMM 6895]MEC4743981.1 hypothetical protein [Cocleimonas sp. KMM 6896]
MGNPLILKAVNAYLRKRLHSQVTRLDNDESIELDQYSIPRLMHFFRQQDEQNQLLSEIERLLNNQIKAEEILVVSASITNKKTLENLISNSLNIPCEVINDANMHRHKGHLGLTSFRFIERHALTSSFIFITGLNILAASEAQFHNDPEKEQNLIEKNSRKLAISMMRAQKAVTLLITADKIPAEFVTPEFEIKTVSLET